MFDYLKCDYPLPARALAQDLCYQTKDFDCTLDQFHIRADGTLWGQDYDIEDRSDPNATGLDRLAGSMTRVNIRPVFREDFSGAVEFYSDYGRERKNGFGMGWLTFRAIFDAGCLQSVVLVADEVPKEIQADDDADEIGRQTPQSSNGGGPERRL